MITGHLPEYHFPNGLLPERSFPRIMFSPKKNLEKNITRMANSPNKYLPEWPFPRINIYPNGDFPE